MSARILATLALMGLLVVSAYAQPALRANIPFDFVVGDARMTAGAYHLVFLHPNVVRISSATAAAIVITNAATGSGPAETSKLVFNRYGSTCFLSTIWRSGYSQGNQLIKSRMEKEYARVRPDRGFELASIGVPAR
jgi:hypothetical protein